MQIKFEFTVDAIDAENIMSCIHGEVCRTLELSLSETCPHVKKAYKDHSDYLKNLMSKMKNKRVENEREVAD